VSGKAYNHDTAFVTTGARSGSRRHRTRTSLLLFMTYHNNDNIQKRRNYRDWRVCPRIYLSLSNSKKDLIPPYDCMLTKRLLVHFLLPPLHLLIVNLPISFILCLHECYVGIFDHGPSRPVASWHLLQSWTDHILFVIGLSVSLIGCLMAFAGADQMAVMV